MSLMRARGVCSLALIGTCVFAASFEEPYLRGSRVEWSSERRLCGSGGGGGGGDGLDPEECVLSADTSDATAFVCLSRQEATESTNFCMASHIYAKVV